MFRGSNQIQIFPFNLIHHGIHLCKTHNTIYYRTSDHKRRNTISKSSANHKISCIRNYCRMQSGNITHQIIEAIACYTSRCIHIDSMKFFHNFCMVGNFKIRYYRFTIFLYFHIFTIIFTNRNRWINNIRNNHHILLDLIPKFTFLCFQIRKTCSISCHFCFLCFCFFSFTLSH